MAKARKSDDELLLIRQNRSLTLRERIINKGFLRGTFGCGNKELTYEDSLILLSHLYKKYCDKYYEEFDKFYDKVLYLIGLRGDYEIDFLWESSKSLRENFDF